MERPTHRLVVTPATISSTTDANTAPAGGVDYIPPCYVLSYIMRIS